MTESFQQKLKKLNDTFGNYNEKVSEIIELAYKQGVKEERDRLKWMLETKRSGLNAQRGGSYTEKEYLKPVNAKVELCDELLRMEMFK